MVACHPKVNHVQLFRNLPSIAPYPVPENVLFSLQYFANHWLRMVRTGTEHRAPAKLHKIRLVAKCRLSSHWKSPKSAKTVQNKIESVGGKTNESMEGNRLEFPNFRARKITLDKHKS